MKGLKIAVVKSSELGNSWLLRDRKPSHWEQLKDIARRRRYHVNALSKLDDEEQAVRKEIENAQKVQEPNS